MARNAKSAQDFQIFAGGLPGMFNNIWAQNLGGGCCQPGIPVDADRLPITLHWENANVHTSPLGGRQYWRWSEVHENNRYKARDHLNAKGVGGQLAVHCVPTFAHVQAVVVKVLAEEPGLTFDLKTRNGLVLPTDVIKVEETDGVDCDGVVREKGAGSLEGFGALGTKSRIYHIAASKTGGEFALEADELLLEVKTMPTSGKIVGFFDVSVEVSYTHYGRSEADANR